MVPAYLALCVSDCCASPVRLDAQTGANICGGCANECSLSACGDGQQWGDS